MATPLNSRVRKHRDELRASGLRPLQIWVPDVRGSGFLEECRRQSRLVARSDAADPTLQGFMDAALTDLVGGSHD
jgi:hypothetical protein